jgi:hypothetical protein
MALSTRERQILADVERHISADDPRLASILSDPGTWPAAVRFTPHPVRRPSPTPPPRPAGSGRDGGPIWATVLVVAAVALIVAGLGAPLPPGVAEIALTGGSIGLICGVVMVCQLWHRHRRV